MQTNHDLPPRSSHWLGHLRLGSLSQSSDSHLGERVGCGGAPQGVAAGRCRQGGIGQGVMTMSSGSNPALMGLPAVLVAV